MLIHSYLTDGFFEWGKFLLTTFKAFHGEKLKFVLTTRNLNESQIEELQKIYHNLVIINEEIDMHELCRKSGIPISKLRNFKKEIETDHIKNRGTRIWKQFISVEDRYRNSIYQVMQLNPKSRFMLHMDVDMYIRGELTELFDLIRKNDISIRFRLGSKENRKVQGGIIGFKLGQPVYEFMHKWIQHIDAIDIKNKPIGYGQTSFYLAYRDMERRFKWGDVPLKFISAHMRPDDIIWSANTPKGKVENLRICREDFERRFK